MNATAPLDFTSSFLLSVNLMCVVCSFPVPAALSLQPTTGPDGLKKIDKLYEKYHGVAAGEKPDTIHPEGYVGFSFLYSLRSFLLCSCSSVHS